MPTYEYVCDECGFRFEKFQTTTEKRQELCPACQHSAQRIISNGSGIIFKGKGFYTTDYAKKNSVS